MAESGSVYMLMSHMRNARTPQMPVTTILPSQVRKSPTVLMTAMRAMFMMRSLMAWMAE